MWSEGVFWSLFHFSVAAHRQAYHGMYDDRGEVEAESERANRRGLRFTQYELFL